MYKLENYTQNDSYTHLQQNSLIQSLLQLPT